MKEAKLDLASIRKQAEQSRRDRELLRGLYVDGSLSTRLVADALYRRSEAFGRILRFARSGIGMSLRDAARLSDINVVRLSNLELGYGAATNEELTRLADVYRPPTRELSFEAPSARKE